jgi:hypothetical protein
LIQTFGLPAYELHRLCYCKKDDSSYHQILKALTLAITTTIKNISTLLLHLNNIVDKETPEMSYFSQD